MKGKTTCFVESSDSDIKKKKLISSAATDSTKTLTKFTVNVRNESLWEGGLYKFTPFWLTGMSVGNDL